MKLNLNSASLNEVGKWLGFTAIALLSGLVGGYFIFNLLSPSIGSVVLNDVSSDMMKRDRLTIKEAKNVVVEHDTNVQAIAADLSQNLLVIIKKTDGNGADWQKRYITNESVVAEAVPMTTDGWLVTNFTGLLGIDGKINTNFLVMDRDGVTYAVEKVINDRFTKLQFVKILASSLRVKKLSITQLGQNGSEYISSDWTNQVELRVLRSVKIGKNISSLKSIDDSVEYLDLDQKLNSLTLVNHGGEIVGLANNAGEVISAQSVNEDFSKILDTGAVSRLSLGFNYVDLNTVFHASTSSNTKKAVGSLVVIEKNNSSLNIGLKNGDIIKTINGNDVERDLFEFLRASKAGQDILLVVERGNQVFDIKLKTSFVR